MTSLRPGTLAWRGATDFAVNLYRELGGKEPAENVFISPLNIAEALAVAANVTAGRTSEEIRKAIGIADHATEADYASALRALDSGVGPANVLARNSKVWTDLSQAVSPDTVAELTSLYGTAPKRTDFKGDPEGATGEINADVAKDTNNLIPQLLPAGFVTSETRAVITSAIYFKGLWHTEFDPGKTIEQGAFHLAGGATAEVPLMLQRNANLPYHRDEANGVQVVRIPYKDSKISFVLVVPDAVDGMAALDAAVSTQQIADWNRGLRKTELAVLGLPRFEFATEYKLKEVLQALGIREVFDEKRADFTKLDPASVRIGDLVASDVIHKAVIKVDEKGSEAAAASAIGVVRTTSVARPKPSVVADRPFLFAIQDDTTGQVLFLGRVMNPKK